MTERATQRTICWGGWFALVCAAVAVVAIQLPIAAKGPFGVTILYLADFSYISKVSAFPLVLYPIAAVTGVVGLLMILGKIPVLTPLFFGLGMAGLLGTVLGIFEGMGHIYAFLNGCSNLIGAEKSDAPISWGSGGLLQVATYGGLVLYGLFSKPQDSPVD